MILEIQVLRASGKDPTLAELAAKIHNVYQLIQQLVNVLGENQQPQGGQT